MEKLKVYKNHPGSLLLRIFTYLAAVFTVSVLGFLIVYILVKGVPHLKMSLFEWEYNSENVSMLPKVLHAVFL